MTNPLDGRNTKKLKKQKLKLLIFSKKAKITIHIIFSKKIQKITILFWVLVFSFTYLVLVYPMDSTLEKVIS